MDQNQYLQTIILGLTTRGLAALIGYAGRKGEKFLLGEELQSKLKENETAIAPRLKKAIDESIETTSLPGPVAMEQVCLFLGTPEVDTIVRQLFSTRLSEQKNKPGLEGIRSEFRSVFSSYTGFEDGAIAQTSHNLFDTLTTACDKALDGAVENGLLSAHEAKSSLRHRVIRDELANI